MVKIARLLKMAEQHRAERELFAAEHLGTTHIEDQMRALRAGYKEIRNAKGDLESWRCSSCGYKILIKRCIACELEIANGRSVDQRSLR
jgi:NAD-dependent SIR2 family protein deacetylase